MKFNLVKWLLILTISIGCSNDDDVTEPEVQTTVTYPGPPLSIAFDGSLLGADYWTDQPEILSASFGFADNIGLIGGEITQSFVEQAGGSWLTDLNCTPANTQANTISVTQDQLANIYIIERPYVDLKDGAIGVDGLPIVFSWPVVTSTIDLTDFQITINTGEVLKPIATSPQPNWENNERNCVTIFGEWGNKKPSSDPEARFVTKVEIVADNTPLMLVGPNNQMVSAVGLTWVNEDNSSPYDENNGPRLVGAKLNYVGQQAIGEGTYNLLFNNQNATLPNDEFALYGDELALYGNNEKFRLRMLTTGGFSPDGIRGVKPTDYERFFRIHAIGVDGETELIEEVGVDYQVLGRTLRVLGLSDLGRKEGNGIEYNDCYAEDRDNYIDIILVGDDAAARNITFLEIPSLEGGYAPLYNPRGPGTTPPAGQLYTQPGPRDLEPVINALDNPMRISN